KPADGSMAARAHNRLQGNLWSSSNDEIRLSAHQVCRADKWTTRVVDGPIFNDDVLSLTKAVLFQLREKSCVIASLRRGQAARAKKCHSWDLVVLLSMCSERPRQSCAGNQSDEFAPFHIGPQASRRDMIARQMRRLKEVQRERLRQAVDVRFGSKADMCSAIGHVRFTPESDAECVPSNIRLEARRSTE